MIGRAEKVLIAVVTLFALLGTGAALVHEASGVGTAPAVEPRAPVTDGASAAPTAAPSAPDWFSTAKPYCNPVEVESHLRWNPAPEGAEGATWQAACLALAGRIADARRSIEGLPADERWRAAGVVFEAGHPAADAGDEVAAGPLMELVVEFWPNHYMALYHAGASRYELGAHDRAEEYLTRFLEHYEIEDGWRSGAQRMLRDIRGG